MSRTFATRGETEAYADSLSLAECSRCCLPFHRDVDWRKLCPPCFKETRGWDLKEVDAQFVAVQVDLHNFMLTSDATKPSAGLDAATIKRLIMLCHPDRHDNSAEANAVTALLLDMRGSL